MPPIQREIVINRPMEEVFDFVTDARNEPRYNPRIESVETFEPVGDGTRMRWVWEVKPRGAVGKLTTPVLARVLGRRLDTAFVGITRVLERVAFASRTDYRV